MISWIKKHFVPHVGNEHRPHALRPKNIRNVVIFILLLELFSFLLPSFTYIKRIGTGNLAAVLPAVLSALTNEQRQEQKLPELAWSGVLAQAAELKAKDMANNGYFAHTSPEGKTPWYWLEKVGYKYQYAGENLAVNFLDSKDVTEAWMNSPSHRANIVKANYTEIGTAIATGLYKGKEAVFVVQLYANPSKFAPGSVPKKIASVVSPDKIPSDIVEQPKEKVLGAQVSEEEEVEKKEKYDPTFLEKIALSPRNTTDNILIVVFCVMAGILLLYILVKFKKHHLDLITNGLIVLALIGVVFIVNSYTSKSSMMVLDSSIDFSSPS